ncbi:MAG: hypothetical protein J6X55_05760 [Victivallales bacterium]|nr:hypothetical protein [Victivallales bacterium]
MLYIERQPGKRSIVLLAILGILLYAGALYVYELRASDEGLQAAMAREMMTTGEYLKTHLYGRPIREYPLYSWLVMLCSGFRAPTVWSLRLPSVLSVLGLATVSGICARRLQSAFAGFIAAAVVLMSVVSFQIGIRAQTEFLQAFLTFSSWWCWYHYGVNEKQWNKAWGMALALVFIGILNAGLEAVFWFYVPLFFMPRQVNAKMRMQMPAHIISVLLVLVLVFLWEWVTPDQPLMPWGQEPGLRGVTHDNTGYFLHLLLFPWKMVYYLLPWSILLWAPFCIALRQFEQAPAACRFFRVIITVIFLCVWFFPGTSPLHMLSLLGPIAVLIGVHFEIVLRRYQHILSKGMRVIAWLIAAGCLATCLFWLAVSLSFIAIEDVSEARSWFSAALTGAVSGVLWSLVLRTNSRCTFRSRIIWCIFGAKILLLCTLEGYIQWNDSDRRVAGESLAGIRRPENAVTSLSAGSLQTKVDSVDCIYYKPQRNNWSLYLAEFFWLDKPLVFIRPKLEWDKALPKDCDLVYVISAHAPPVTTREWRPLSEVVDMRLRRHPSVSFSDWKGGRPFVRIRRVPDGNDKRPSVNLQLFEGVRVKETN